MHCNWATTTLQLSNWQTGQLPSLSCLAWLGQQVSCFEQDLKIKKRGGSLPTPFLCFFFRRERTQRNWAIGQLTNWSVAQFVVLGVARTTGELFRAGPENKEARGIPANTISVLFFLQGTDTMQLGNWATDELVSCPVCRAWRD